jgi:gas vesicle protein
MTSSDPEVIRRQIEDTRANLSYDVDALNEKVNPGRVVDRRVGRARSSVTSLKDRVFGAAQQHGHQASGTASNVAGNVQGAAHSAAGNVQNAASSAVGTVQQAPDIIQRQAQGNPLAAGVIAFGVGWLVSSLLPTSEKEKQLASQAESAVKEHSQPLVDQAKNVAQEIGDNLKPAAQDAVESVKSTAQEGVQTVKSEGQSAAQDVQGQAQDSRQTVQGQATS